CMETSARRSFSPKRTSLRCRRRPCAEPPHGGEPSDYAGPRLEDVLAPANLPRGPQLRGAEVTRYVVVEAVDGYRALFALAEFDSAFRAEVPILALRRNGAPLEAEAGHFQIIV